MESRFGHDFSRVRIHTDATAGQACAAVRAHAFTVGSEIVFAAGQFAPGAGAGDHLLAHELTHVIQQGGAPGMTSTIATGGSSRGLAGAAAERVAQAPGAARFLAAPPNIARKPARSPAGTNGHLSTDSHWSYIVYDNEVRLRYFLKLSKEEVEARKKKNLPGFIQVGTIPWITNNPGNITQEPGAAKTTLQGYPAELGSLGTYGNRYAIFSSREKGVEAIGGYLRKRPEFGKNKDLSVAGNIKQYKGEEKGERAQREAREKENAERISKGEKPLPAVDVREKYLRDVEEGMKRQIVADEALEGGMEVKDLTGPQRAQLEKEAAERVRQFMSGKMREVSAGDEDLALAVESIQAIEGRAAAPGVTFSCAGFDDPTTQAAYDGQQKALIKALTGSEAAKKELSGLLGCGGER